MAVRPWIFALTRLYNGKGSFAGDIDMPKWWVHDKWASKMGISLDTSRRINELIDFPQEFLPKGIGLNLGHDEWRRTKVGREMLDAVAGTDEGIRAAHLHNSLDYLDAISNPSIRGRMAALARTAIDNFDKLEARGVVHIDRDPFGRVLYRNEEPTEWHGEQVRQGRVLPRNAYEIGKRLKGLRAAPEPVGEMTLMRELQTKMEEMSIRTDVRQFVMLNFKEILRDIYQGRGVSPSYGFDDLH